MNAPAAHNLDATQHAGEGAVVLLTKVLRVTRIALVFVLVTVIGTAARMPFFSIARWRRSGRPGSALADNFYRYGC